MSNQLVVLGTYHKTEGAKRFRAALSARAGNPDSGEATGTRRRRKMSNQPVVLGTYNGVDIMARVYDNFIDVTQLCQAHGEEW